MYQNQNQGLIPVGRAPTGEQLYRDSIGNIYALTNQGYMLVEPVQQTYQQPVRQATVVNQYQPQQIQQIQQRQAMVQQNFQQTQQMPNIGYQQTTQQPVMVQQTFAPRSYQSQQPQQSIAQTAINQTQQVAGSGFAPRGYQQEAQQTTQAHSTMKTQQVPQQPVTKKVEIKDLNSYTAGNDIWLVPMYDEDVEDVDVIIDEKRKQYKFIIKQK